MIQFSFVTLENKPNCEFRVNVGSSIYDALEELIFCAELFDSSIMLVFNDRNILITPGDSVKGIIEEYKLP